MGGPPGRLISIEERILSIELINEACRSGARKKKACEVLGISLRTFERWQKNNELIDKRQSAKKIPKNKLTTDEIKMILHVSNSVEYSNLPPCKIVPILADKGKYIASESSFYRVLRQADQIKHRGFTKPKIHKKPVLVAQDKNYIWSWDITYLPSQVRGIYFYLYFIMDIYSRKIVGWSIHEQESSYHASRLIEQCCADEKVKKEQLVLHSDNGSPMKGITMIVMLEKLGVVPSFSRPSVSNDNPYSESLFKTLKYHPTYPKQSNFNLVDDARAWCETFVSWYNNDHLHSGLKFITPNQRHNGQWKYIMKNRHAVYESAKKIKPERWSKNTRNWDLPTFVTLNPIKNKDELNEIKMTL